MSCSVEISSSSHATVGLGAGESTTASDSTRDHEFSPADSLVALVEDDDDIREVVADLLADEGYRVLAYASADLALRDMKAGRHPDLILLDPICCARGCGTRLDAIDRHWRGRSWCSQAGVRSQHRVRVRAYDGRGQLQPLAVAPPHPAGASGVHEKWIEVAPDRT